MCCMFLSRWRLVFSAFFDCAAFACKNTCFLVVFGAFMFCLVFSTFFACFHFCSKFVGPFFGLERDFPKKMCRATSKIRERTRFVYNNLILELRFSVFLKNALFCRSDSGWAHFSSRNNRFWTPDLLRSNAPFSRNTRFVTPRLATAQPGSPSVWKLGGSQNPKEGVRY